MANGRPPTSATNFGVLKGAGNASWKYWTSVQSSINTLPRLDLKCRCRDPSTTRRVGRDVKRENKQGGIGSGAHSEQVDGLMKRHSLHSARSMIPRCLRCLLLVPDGACSSTICVVFSRLSGGYPYHRRHATRMHRLALTFSRTAQRVVTFARTVFRQLARSCAAAHPRVPGQRFESPQMGAFRV